MSSQIVERVSQEKIGFSSPVIRWLDHRLPIFTFLHHELHACPTPRNLNYLWNFGPLAGISLIIVSNPLLIAATAVVGLIAFPLLQPKWVMVK
jgi:quinol-cytochrome oxidoreductase complex cytochrome b subunit